MEKIRRFSQDQKGGIAIMFVMLSGVLLGMVAFGFEGSRYLMEKARLSDAMEQAALALAAEDNGKLTAAAVSRNRFLASEYFRRYMRNEKSVSVPVVDVSNMVSVNENVQYVEYRVSAQTLHTSWFSSSFFPSFQPTVSVGDNGAARKYRSNIDVVFATDFSNSMNYILPGGSSRIKELKRIVLQLSRELYSYHPDNKVGFVPFDWGMHRDGNCRIPLSTKVKVTDIDDVIVAGLDRIVDYEKTISSIPNESSTEINVPLSRVYNGRSFGSTWACLKASPMSLETDLTSDYTKLLPIRNMPAGGNTFVSSGILRAAQLLGKSTAAKRVMVIVSDGQDSVNAKITPTLIAKGMCEKIKQVMSTRYSVGKIAFVGIGYTPTVDWKLCVGENNFYISTNVRELENDLRQAVFEEVGHNTLKRF
ncbi:TadE/TadG family type IV pilus assembly protein [Budvicia diplopodorum]|uniref:TadE/TadG family type IV pilus assembly protein n=1 Tax=Budvicia diplopodorum TaxID=1119056 RepID=UPI001FE6F8D4|nr:pilus assembly protein [Budvicia diplopodorum]